MNILTADNLSKTYGDKVLFSDLSLIFFKPEDVG